jgi:hypothetical protein
MDSKIYRGLVEAYSEVYKEEIISEDPIQDFRDRTRSAENKSGVRGPELSHSVASKGTPKPGSSSTTKPPRSREFSHGGPTPRSREFAREDLFDIIKGHLIDEGFVDNEKSAYVIMSNMSEEWRNSIIEEYIDEAEGSYGQTPKAKKAMGALANDRRNKPATEYSQKGEKTKKVKAAEKQTKRQDMLSRGLSGGKKSSRPFSSRGKMDADERTERRSERAFDLETKYGEGSVTKNPKKLRKQKAMGEHD